VTAEYLPDFLKPVGTFSRYSNRISLNFLGNVLSNSSDYSFSQAGFPSVGINSTI
jgi:hypothetical protein